MITKVTDPKEVLHNWLMQMADQKNFPLENLKKDFDVDIDTEEDEIGDDVEYLDVESVEYVHVDQEYYQEELYHGMTSGNLYSILLF